MSSIQSKEENVAILVDSEYDSCGCNEFTKLNNKICALRCKKCCYKNYKDESDEEDNYNVIEKEQSIELTRTYMLNENNSKNEILLFYLNELFKNDNHEKIDYIFIDELLSINKIDVNYCDSNNENSILKAIKLDDDVLIEYLLKKKANINQINNIGCNVFHFSAKYNKKATITRLLAEKFKKVNLDKYLNDKTLNEMQTPLHYAAKSGYDEVAECLISEFSVDKECLDNYHRTPLYIAAEYNFKTTVQTLMRLNCCISFTDLKRKETLYNKNGQTALYWIVTKMPEMANDALNKLSVSNSYLKEDMVYLSPLEPKVFKKLNEKGENEEIIQKSVLAGIIESYNYDLIVHPVVRSLINIKWNVFGSTIAWGDFIVSILNCSIWIPLVYFSAQPSISLMFYAFALLILIYLFIKEVTEISNQYKYQKKTKIQRLKELDEYSKDNTSSDAITDKFIKEERNKLDENDFKKFIFDYFTEFWNLYDLMILILLVASIGTYFHYLNTFHLKFINTLFDNKRLIAITIIFVFTRILKSSRIIVKKFGTLVTILYYLINDIIIWLILFVVIWMGFSCCFFMLYGETQIYNYVQNTTCDDFNPENCTTTIASLSTFYLTANTLYRLTFGNGIDETTMNQIDTTVTSQILIASYISITALIFINILIALLSSTFQRVFEQAEAFIIFQRATEILNSEKAMNYEEKRVHWKYLKRITSPYRVKLENKFISKSDDTLSNIENSLNQEKNVLNDLKKAVEFSNLSFKKQIVQTEGALSRLEQQEIKIAELIEREKKIDEFIIGLNNKDALKNKLKELMKNRVNK